jgi:hypothetical protein
MRRSIFHHQQTLFATLILLSFACPAAWATGTAPATVISDTAVLSYSIGGEAPVEVVSSPSAAPAEAGKPTTFTAGIKINVAVTQLGGSAVNVSPGQTGATAAFSVINSGNTVQDYALTTFNLGNGTMLFGRADSFDAAACHAYAETNNEPGYQPGQDMAAYIDELRPDTSITVYVSCNIPDTEAGAEAVICLEANTRAAPGAGEEGGVVTQAADTLFADTAGSDDKTGDAKYSARHAFLVTPAN